MVMDIFAVASGGALGALTRYATMILTQSFWGMRFPYGTLLVNCIGSFIAGFFLAFLAERWSGSEYFRLFMFTGFLGAFTTFSSFAAENLSFYEHGQWLKLSVNILLNNAGSLIAVFAGWQLVRLLQSNEWINYVR